MRITSTLTTLLLLCAAQVGVLQAQEDTPTLCDSIPYNPDWDCDGLIGVFDFLPFASLFGNDFLAEIDSLVLAEDLDPDPTNELQWLAIDGDTLLLMMPDSSVYSSVYIGGADGVDGLSAYELWLAENNSGTIQDFLFSLIGEQGPQGEQGPEGPQGPEGDPGLNGADGADGINGTDGADGANGANGANGLSAYEIWLAADNAGTEADFLASLVGADGGLQDRKANPEPTALLD